MNDKTTKNSQDEGKAPVSSACLESVDATRWKGEYFNNTSLTGSPVMVRDDGAGPLNFDWGLGSPSSVCKVNSDNFSVRWTRLISFSTSGTYRFTVTTDDGVRLYIDGALKLNKWIIRGPTTDTVDVPLTAGMHTLKMEYFEAGGGAVAKLNWKLEPANCMNKEVPAGHWKGEYFNNTSLSGSPVMVRDDGTGALSFDWGLGSPSSACGIPVDNFSVRWTRQIEVLEGTYRFTITTDDGVRLYVDDILKLDKWVVRGPTTDAVNVTLTRGIHRLRIEYFEAGGGAVAKLAWQPASADGCMASVPAGHWKGEYFNNTSLSGSPVMVRDDGAGSLNFDWGLGSPSSACGIPVDNFSVRWTRQVDVLEDTYRFTITTDDGIRLYIDDELKLDKWVIRGPTTDMVDATLTRGIHRLRIEYFEAGGGAVAKLEWRPITPVPTDCIKSVPAGHWRGEYFNNTSLSGNPVMVQDDGAGPLDFDWGLGSPSSACGIPVDNFSVRWTRQIDVLEGTYRFTITTDDGVRLYIDGVLKLDNWVIRAPTTDTIDIPLTAGMHTLKVEYFEAAGGAIAKLDWELGVAPPKLLVLCKEREEPCTEIDLGIASEGTQFHEVFYIKNVGSGTVTGSVNTDGWFAIDPSSFELAPGDKAEISMSGTFPSDIKPFSRTVHITSTGGEQHLKVRGITIPSIRVLYKEREEPCTEIDLGIASEGTQFHEVFYIKNVSSGTVTGSVNTDGWFAIDPSSFELAPGDKAEISMSGTFPSVLGSFKRTIHITSNRGDKRVEVHGEVAPKLQVSCGEQVPCTEIDLGVAGAGTLFHEVFYIRNVAGGLLTGSVTSEEWFTIDPSNFELFRGAQAEISVSGTFPSLLGPFSGTIHITSDGGDQSVEIHGDVGMDESFGIVFEGPWDETNKAAVREAVVFVGARLNIPGVPLWQDFQAVFGTQSTPLVFQWGPPWTYTPGAPCDSITFGGCVTGLIRRGDMVMLLISFAGMYHDPPYDDAWLRNRNMVVHELGHLFGARYRYQDRTPYEYMSEAISQDNRLARSNPGTGKYYGFASGFNYFTWQMAYVNAQTSHEIFADQFLAWTFDTYYSGPENEERDLEKAAARRNWMNDNMAEWLRGTG